MPLLSTQKDFVINLKQICLKSGLPEPETTDIMKVRNGLISSLLFIPLIFHRIK